MILYILVEKEEEDIDPELPELRLTLEGEDLADGEEGREEMLDEDSLKRKLFLLIGGNEGEVKHQEILSVYYSIILM